MGLSSNTLWHQTKIDGLRGIISKRRFSVSYSLEKLKSTSPFEFSYAFPMISFSDIPLSEFESHLNKYGGFSIGMKREWFLRKQFSPVSYFSDYSILLRDIIERITFYISNYPTLTDNERTDLELLFFQLSFSKNYEGPLITSYKDYKNYRFSDEREWRYVPSKGSSTLKPYIPENEYIANKAIIQEEARRYYMSFKFSDINYIIVKDESQIVSIRNLVNRLLSTPNDLGEIDDVNSVNISFLTTKQVENDIFGKTHDIEILH
jgi:hypothetical protein